MKTPEHDDITTPTTTTTTTTHDTAGTDPSVLRAHRELAVLQERLNELFASRPTRDADWAARSARLALIFARRAGWWSVLSWASYRADLHPVYRQAVVITRCHERDRARYWRDSAAEWTARAEHRPTSDAAGALSNWHELGVTT